MSVRPTAMGPPAYVLEGNSDIWSSRSKTAGLIAHLTRRHLAARYRGSTLGFLWSLLNPILMMCVYTFVFQYVLRFETPGVPFPVFFLTGLLAWNFIHTATLNAAASILDNHMLIKQAYFPRIALPLSAVLANGVNYVISVPLVVVFNLFFGIHPGWTIVLLPVALVFLTVLATGLGLLAASLTPFFRDLTQLLDLVFLAWFFASPVIYPLSFPRENLPQAAFTLYELNPVAGAMMLVRAALLQESLDPWTVGLSTLSAAALLVLGWRVFRRLEPRFSTAV